MIPKNDSREAAAALKKEFSRIRYTAYLMIAVVIIVILVSVLRKFWLTMIFIAVALFLQLFVFRKMQRQYVEHAVEQNIRATIGKILDQPQITMKGEGLLSEEAVRRADLVPAIPRKGAINFFAAVSGYTGSGEKRMQVTSCDVTIAKHQEGTKVSAEILCGNWIHISLPGKTGHRFTVRDGKVRGSFSGDKIKGSGDEHKDAQVGGVSLPEHFYRRLEKLEGYTTGSISMRVEDDTADVFLKDRFLAQNFSARSEITERMIDWNPLPELEKVLDLVWTLV